MLNPSVLIMFIKDLKCSNCGSNDFVAQSIVNYRCSYCGTINYLHITPNSETSYKPVNQNYSTVVKPKYILWIAAGILFSGILVSVIMSLTSNYVESSVSHFSTPESKIEINGVEYYDTLSTMLNHPQLELLWYEFSDTVAHVKAQSFIINGELKNKSGALVKNPEIIFTFYNKGNKNYSINITPNESFILPDKSLFFSYSWPFFSSFDSTQIDIKMRSFGFSAPDFYKFEILDEKFSIESGDRVKLEGVLKNSSDTSLYLSGHVDFFDENGKFVGSQNINSPGVLRKGEKSIFKITPGFYGPGKNRYPDLIRAPKSYKINIKTRASQ